MFVDEVDIQVTAGDGGRGCVSFRREKFVPRGGPNGGDGGDGGSIVLVASPHYNTLHSFRFHHEFRAPRGTHGQGYGRTGKRGAIRVLQVPIGTVVFEQTPAGLVLLGDLATEGAQLLVARGGHGGRGNARFATPTNRAPRRAEPGAPGETRSLRLELKLLADVGLVGFPNAGKSTLIARISAARPKIADYPFTTLIPNLGVVALAGDRTFVVADVPGLIEGAHEGHGLGDHFLRHLERTRVLVHLVDVSSGEGREPLHDLDVIERELALFHRQDDDKNPLSLPGLAEKPRIVAATKIDVMDDSSRLTRLAEAVTARGLPFIAISAVTGEGIPVLGTGVALRRTTAGLRNPLMARRSVDERGIPMRLGILGGTFDPIHQGHIDAAAAARRVLGLDPVLFIPACVPPHRARAPVASPFHRFAMTGLAVLGKEGFEASDLEMARPGPSFSVDTLRLLRKDGWLASQLFFISGIDAFADVATWRDYPALLDDSHFVVVTRPGYTTKTLRAELPDLADRFVEADDADAAAKRLDGPETAIVLVNADTPDVSSTEVRRRVAAHEPLGALVPKHVECYIHQHHLYNPPLTAPQLHGQI